MAKYTVATIQHKDGATHIDMTPDTKHVGLFDRFEITFFSGLKYSPEEMHANVYHPNGEFDFY